MSVKKVEFKSFLKMVRLSTKNIRRHPVKNILVGLVIVLAGVIFFTTGSLAANARSNWRDFFATTFLGDYNVTTYQRKDKDFTLPVLSLPETFISTEFFEELEKTEVIYSPRVKTGAVVYNEETGEFEGTPVTLVGIDFQGESRHLTNIQFLSGTVKSELDTGILVWKELADYYGWNIGKEITLFLKDIDGNTIPFSFIIAGIISNKTGESLAGTGSFPIFPLIFGSYEYISLVLGLEEGAATDLAVWDRKLLYDKEVGTLANKYGLQFFYGEQGFEVIWGIIEFIFFIGAFIEVFILIVLIISTFNLNMMGFSERRKEIGTMCAIGAKSSWIVGLLLFEMIIFSMFAFAMSIGFYLVLTVVTAKGINLGGGLGLAFAGANIHLKLISSTAIVSFISIIITMIASSAYPIYLTTKINPVEVFREAKL